MKWYEEQERLMMERYRRQTLPGSVEDWVKSLFWTDEQRKKYESGIASLIIPDDTKEEYQTGKGNLRDIGDVSRHKNPNEPVGYY